MPRTVRKASHAGDWYDSDGKRLTSQISSWLLQASADPHIHARAIISPHAGYRFCGHVMAYAYKQIQPEHVNRIFILGPSHHCYTRQCLLSKADQYDTPLGPINLDLPVIQDLINTRKFDYMNHGVDEAEHSLELQISFIQHILRGKAFTLVPIMVGSLSLQGEEEYGRLLSPYLDDPGNLFVISSDFCHWGSRFSYQCYDDSQGDIHQFIEWLDKTGMDIIEQGKPAAFTKYLQEYNNTICGRHPISVFLQMLQANPLPHRIKFTKYDQSSKCRTKRDSSVSYAAAVVIAS
eukprot:jgi/Botrbrau1/5825/Bobra.0366s0010.1